jgi:hypothetical protein
LPAPLLPLVVPALARDPRLRPTAAELLERAATLDPAALMPSAGTLAGLSGQPYTRAATAADAALQPGAGPAAAVWVPSRPVTRPLPDSRAGEIGAAAAAGAAGAMGAAGAVGRPATSDWAEPEPAAGPPQPGGASAPPLARRSRRSRIPLAAAAVVTAIAASVLLPVAGTAAALGGLIALRIAGLTSGRLARRRSERGSRATDPLAAAAFLPVAVCRTALRFLLLAPIALIAAAAVAAVTIIVIPADPFPRAIAYAAAAVVACYGLGPGSRGSRRPLGTVLRTATGGSAALSAIAFIGLAALAVFLLSLAASAAPVYWPVSHLGNQLQQVPSPHSVLSEVRHSLLRLAGRFGV